MHSPIRHHWQLFVSTAAIALSIAAGHALASAQEDADDIRDKPVDKVERKLSGRGYQAAGSVSRDGSQYWWNRDQDRCLQVHVRNGRVGHAEVRDERDCRDASKQKQSYADRAPSGGYSGLMGMRASYLDGEMASRGFRNAGGYKEGNTSFTTWWNKSTRECLSVATREGRIDNVRSIAEGNCR